MSEHKHFWPEFFGWLKVATIATLVFAIYSYWDATKFDDTEMRTLGKFFGTFVAGGAGKAVWDKWMN